MKIKLSQVKVKSLADRCKVAALRWGLTPRYLGFCLLSIAYFLHSAPVLCTIGVAIALFCFFAVSIASQFFPMSTRSKSLFVGLLGATLIFSTFSLPSYAILDGFQSTVETIIEATGGGVDQETGQLIADLLRLAIFVAIFILIVVGAVNRQEEERLKSVATAGIILVGVVVLMEVAGNYIFESGGGV